MLRVRVTCQAGECCLSCRPVQPDRRQACHVRADGRLGFVEPGLHAAGDAAGDAPERLTPVQDEAAAQAPERGPGSDPASEHQRTAEQTQAPEVSTSGRPHFKAWRDPIRRSEAFQQLEELMQQRMVFIDGAMGTAIQAYGLQEDDYRGDRFALRQSLPAWRPPVRCSTDCSGSSLSSACCQAWSRCPC